MAIVGAGPSGLSCAYHLALQGYKAVIFEAAPEAGGWLRYGIPEYRLPREVLQREVDYIKRLRGGDSLQLPHRRRPHHQRPPHPGRFQRRLPRGGGPGFHPPAGAGVRGPGRPVGRGIPEGFGLTGRSLRLRRQKGAGHRRRQRGHGRGPHRPAPGGRRHPHLPGNPGRDARLPLGSGRGRARGRRRSSTAGASKQINAAGGKVTGLDTQGGGAGLRRAGPVLPHLF